jgi:hypothetical protein
MVNRRELLGAKRIKVSGETMKCCVGQESVYRESTVSHCSPEATSKNTVTIFQAVFV